MSWGSGFIRMCLAALAISLGTLAGTMAVRLLLIRVGWIHPDSHPFATLVFLPALLPSVVWSGWVAARLPRVRGSWLARGVRATFVLYTLTMIAPVLLLGWHLWDIAPVALLVWITGWHAILTGLVILGGLTGFAVIAGRFSLSRPGGARSAPRMAMQPETSPSSDRPEGRRLTRRSFLNGAIGIAPLVLTGGMFAASLRQQGRFLVRQVEISVPRLPSRLRGLTITHVSDLHVGRLFRPEYLPSLVEAVNGLDSDLVAFTGDAVDHQFSLMPAACDALRAMQSRYGRFVVVGNHDLLDAPGKAVEYLRAQVPVLLTDELADLTIDGEHLRVAGLFWSSSDRAARGALGHHERANRVLANADDNRFTIALAHHPHAFDALSDAGADLVLSGHTHGGQAMLKLPGLSSPVGAGSLRFRYIWGEYRRGRSVMHVTSGVGSGWPLRINAPAEVVQLRLL